MWGGGLDGGDICFCFKNKNLVFHCFCRLVVLEFEMMNLSWNSCQVNYYIVPDVT